MVIYCNFMLHGESQSPPFYEIAHSVLSGHVPLFESLTAKQQKKTSAYALVVVSSIHPGALALLYFHDRDVSVLACLQPENAFLWDRFASVPLWPNPLEMLQDFAQSVSVFLETPPAKHSYLAALPVSESKEFLTVFASNPAPERVN